MVLSIHTCGADPPTVVSRYEACTRHIGQGMVTVRRRVMDGVVRELTAAAQHITDPTDTSPRSAWAAPAALRSLLVPEQFGGAATGSG